MKSDWKLDDWIREFEVRVGGRKDRIAFLENKCEVEKKYKQENSFNSFKRKKEEEEKQLAFDEQLLGYLKELEILRNKNKTRRNNHENDR